jgi:hypothetical protein
VSAGKLQDLKTKLTQTKAALDSGNTSAVGGLSREDVLGDMFYAVTLGYFGQYISLAGVTSTPNNARHNLPMGYGTFGYEANVQSLFGIPRALTTGGVVVNVRLGYVVQSLNGDATKRLRTSMQTGMLSSVLESAIPDQMFSASTQGIQSVSATKALQLAANQGQRVYHITPANQAAVLPGLHLDSLAMDEITQGLATGREVIAHTDRISMPGWTGEGYVIYDPATGSGAYKIAGGTNGDFSTWCGIAVFAIQAIVVAVLLAALIAIIISGLPALVATAATAAEVMTGVTAYITSAVASLPAAVQAAAGAAMLAIVSEQVAAGDLAGVTELCQNQNTDGKPTSGGICTYQCASDLAVFDAPSKVHTVCGGGQERYCPAMAKRPPGLKP